MTVICHFKEATKAKMVSRDLLVQQLNPPHSGCASFWGDAHTIRMWMRNCVAKFGKCVPTKRNKKTNATCPKHPHHYVHQVIQRKKKDMCKQCALSFHLLTFYVLWSWFVWDMLRPSPVCLCTLCAVLPWFCVQRYIFMRNISERCHNLPTSWQLTLHFFACPALANKFSLMYLRMNVTDYLDCSAMAWDWLKENYICHQPWHATLFFLWDTVRPST